MIKGYRKNMIAVNGGNGDIFETAYFILKDECKFDEISETCIECAQIGLVRLSPVDNQTLYDIIINEISPIFPDEVY